MRENVIDELARDGYILDPEAERFVLAQSNPFNFARGCIDRMEERPLVITMGHLRKVCIIEPDRDARLTEEAATDYDMGPKEYANGDIVVLSDITGMSDCNASVEGFATYFQDRFQTLKGLLQRRRDLVGSTTIDRALDSNRLMVEKSVKIIGMVNEVKDCRSGGDCLDKEDETGKITVMIPKESRLANESILPDEVIGIIGKPISRDKKLRADTLIRPDVPHGSGMERRDLSSVIGFMSDVHVGSNTFLRRQWEEMIDYVRQEAPNIGLEYLVIPGDCVDGIGVYPNQEEELELDDIFDQYHALSELVKDIPDYIHIIVQPGNHDAVRPAEPQPAFSGELAKMFDSSTILLGNPSYFQVEGRTILSYHGKSFDDLMASVKGLSYANPIGAMKEMLKRRHLAPIYGGRTPLAPEKKDFLAIDQVPDIFVTGHVHGAGVDHYNGVRLINASTWQSQTTFQKMHNFNPDPAKLMLVHLGNGLVQVVDFNS
ncbi:MAG: DNA polymerase II small subunit [Methanomassiliicoccales archaeon PtaU1.Bin124]|nr:MAG: DNA polymerase II small subunit [Methanomassiliicoccales archaeon PtaU1.Bin124]